VQYLVKPIQVIEQVRRGLKPGCPFIVSYSNRSFPTKAVAIWRSLDLQRQAALIKLYLERVGFSSMEIKVVASGMHSDPLIALVGHA
jgi:hypothetical protein